MAFVDDFNSFMNVMGLILMWGWPFMILIWLFVLKTLYKKWPIEAIIIEKRGSNLVKTNDRCGRSYDDASGVTCYKLQKSKDTIPVYNYDWVLHNVAIPTTIFERFVNLLRGNIGTLFLFRYGSKQYKPIVIKQNGMRKTIFKTIKNSEGEPVLMKIYEQFDPRRHLGALEFEVVDWDNMNFMVQEQRATIERRKKKSDFIKGVLVPLGMALIAGLVCIIMIKFSYDYAIGMAGRGSESNQNNQNDKPAEKPNGIPLVGDIIPGG